MTRSKVVLEFSQGPQGPQALRAFNNVNSDIYADVDFGIEKEKLIPIDPAFTFTDFSFGWTVLNGATTYSTWDSGATKLISTDQYFIHSERSNNITRANLNVYGWTKNNGVTYEVVINGQLEFNTITISTSLVDAIEDDVVTLTATISGNAKVARGLTYTWNTPLGPVVVEDNNTFTAKVNLGHDGDYSVTVSGNPTIIFDTPLTSPIFTQSVRVKPTLGVVTLTGPTSVNAGDTITLTASHTGTATPATGLTYTWNKPPLSFFATTSTTNVLSRGTQWQADAGDYSVTLAIPRAADSPQISNKISITSSAPVAPTGDGDEIIDYNDGTDDWRAHIFKSNGNFNVSNTIDVEYLIVAGGGRGGYNRGGGGGGGGVLTGSISSLSAGTYPIVIGNGGGERENGQNSSFNSLIAIGGGKGGDTFANGANGGSGGGGGLYMSATVSVGGAGNVGQGNNGGNGGNPEGGGGGGGAGAVGSTAVNSTGGNGGNGLSSSITGTSLVYGSGGGGGGVSGSENKGISGSGAGNGGSITIPATDALPNRGGGGGGGGSDPQFYIGKGGSGIVVIRYKG